VFGVLRALCGSRRRRGPGPSQGLAVLRAIASRCQGAPWIVTGGFPWLARLIATDTASHLSDLFARYAVRRSEELPSHGHERDAIQALLRSGPEELVPVETRLRDVLRVWQRVHIIGVVVTLHEYGAVHWFFPDGIGSSSSRRGVITSAPRPSAAPETTWRAGDAFRGGFVAALAAAGASGTRAVTESLLSRAVRLGACTATAFCQGWPLADAVRNAAAAYHAAGADLTPDVA